MNIRNLLNKIGGLENETNITLKKYLATQNEKYEKFDWILLEESKNSQETLVLKIVEIYNRINRYSTKKFW